MEIITKNNIKKYSTYKNSGVEWLGEIPEHWEVKKVKYLFLIGRGRVIAQTELDDNGKYPVYSSQTLNNGILGYINTYDFDATQLTWTTDGANAGTIFLRKGKYNCTNVCGTLFPKNINFSIEFTKYILEVASVFYKRPDTNGAKIMNGEMAEIPLTIPPLSEQTKIAEFLDDKTKKIDEAIAIKTQQINLLKERKQILIHKAVTRGLDTNVKLKNSGVEWIGEIPVGWEVICLKYLIRAIGDIDHYMPETIETGYPYVMTGDLEGLASEIDFANCKQISKKDYDKLSKKIRSTKGDIILARYATIGTLTYVDINIDFLVSYSCVTIKPKQSKLKGKFLFNYLMSDAFAMEIKHQTNTNTQGNVGIGDLKNIKIVIPPLSEQKEISSYIEKSSEKIATAIGLKSEEIEKLKEYKSSLINSVVTGKVRVC